MSDLYWLSDAQMGKRNPFLEIPWQAPCGRQAGFERYNLYQLQWLAMIDATHLKAHCTASSVGPKKVGAVA